ncbi:MAG: hypothetical protein KAR79_05580 [Simkaniaceae bacterium]|nr:hypothetical protein [Simkaniaceae bacterium]
MSIQPLGLDIYQEIASHLNRSTSTDRQEIIHSIRDLFHFAVTCTTCKTACTNELQKIKNCFADLLAEKYLSSADQTKNFTRDQVLAIALSKGFFNNSLDSQTAQDVQAMIHVLPESINTPIIFGAGYKPVSPLFFACRNNMVPERFLRNILECGADYEECMTAINGDRILLLKHFTKILHRTDPDRLNIIYQCFKDAFHSKNQEAAIDAFDALQDALQFQITLPQDLKSQMKNLLNTGKIPDIQSKKVQEEVSIELLESMINTLKENNPTVFQFLESTDPRSPSYLAIIQTLLDDLSKTPDSPKE